MKKVEDIKKRHENRKRYMKSRAPRSPRYSGGGPKPPVNTPGGAEGEQLFRPQSFIIKCMAAACLILVAGIVYKQPAGVPSQAKELVNRTLTQEVNFSKVSAWYKDTFGKPLALFPGETSSKPTNSSPAQGSRVYAFPVNGQVTVTKEFSKTNKGIIIQTEPGSSVTAVKTGYVADIVEKPNIGTTVVIRHNGEDNTESWYGKLSDVNVKLYEVVQKGQTIGTVSAAENGEHGLFYFALKEGETFIDPIQVISFD